MSNKQHLPQHSKYKLLKIGQAAKYLNVSIDTLRRWEKANKIRVIKTPGGTRFYSTKDLNKLAPQDAFSDVQVPVSVPSYFASEETTKVLSPQESPTLSYASSYIHTQKPLEIKLTESEDLLEETLDEEVNILTPHHIFKGYAVISTMAVLSAIIVLSTAATFLPISNLQKTPFNLKNNIWQQESSVVASTVSQSQQKALAAKANLSSQVLAASTSARLLQIDANTTILGNLTAPNIIYGIIAGNNVTVSPGQTPTISVDLPTLVSSVQGQTGAVVFTAGTDISISGLSISDTSTLASVRSRGGCTNCITNDDIQHNLTITSDGNVAVGALNGVVPISKGGTNTGTLGSAGSVAFSNGTSYAFTSVGTSGFLLSSNGSGTPTWIDPSSISGTSYWQRNNGVLSPTNITDDLAIGGTATSSALFHVEGVSGNTTIGGNLTFNSTLFTSLTGNGLTTSSNILTVNLVSSATNSATLNSASGLEFKDGALSMLRGCANGQLLKWNDYSGTPANSWVCANDSGATSAVINVQENGVAVGTNIDTLNFGGSDFNVNASGSTDTITIDYANSGITRKAQNETITGVWNFSNGVGIGTSSPIGLLGVSGAPPGKALAVFDYTGTDQNILTASASGSTKFLIGNNGNIGFSGSTSVLNTITSAATTARTYTFPDSTGTVCLTSGNCAGVAGIGGSGTTNFIPKFTTSTTIGNSALFDNGNVAIGTTSPIGLFNVNGVSGGNATVVFNTTNGTNDLFTASSSGTTKFTIANNGTITTALGAGVVHSNASGVLSSSSVTNSDLQNSSITFAGDSGSGAISLGSALTIAGTSTQGISTSFSGSTLTVTASNASDTQKGVASFNNTNFTVSGAGAVNTVQNINTSASPTFAGLTLSNFTSNGGILYTNGSGVLAQVTAGTSSQCLFGGTTPSFGSCATGTNWWNVNSGALSPINSTLDLLLGSTATTSAKFAFTNVNSGTPTASISANTANNATYITGAGNLGTTNNQTLLLGGLGTGDIAFAPGGATTRVAFLSSGNIGIGTTIAGKLLTVGSSGQLTVDGANGNLSTSGSITTTGSGTGTFAGLLSANGGLTVANGQNTTLASFTSNGGILYTNGSGVVQQVAAGSSTQVLHGGTSPSFGAVVLTTDVSGTLPVGNGGTGTATTFTQGSIVFAGASGVYTQNNGEFFFDNTNLALGIGTTTPFGKFTINGQRAGQALALLNYTGTDQNILTASVSGTTKFNITNSGNIGFAGNSNVINTLTTNATSAQTYTFPDATGIVCLSTGNCAGAGSGVTTLGGTTNFVSKFTGSQAIGNSSIFDNGNVAIGTTTPIGIFTVSGIAGANATVVFNTGNALNDLFTASSSGTTKFTIANNGNIQFAGSTNFTNTLTSLATAARTYTFPDTTGTICLVEAGNCAGSGTGVTTPGGTTNQIPKFTAAQSIGNSVITDNNGNIGISSTNPLARLDVEGIAGGNATVIFNTGNLINDLFTASASGTTKFTVSNNGNLSFAGNTNFLTTLTSLASANRTITLPDASGTVCLSTNNCGFSSGTNWWNVNSGALYPINQSLDLLIGSTATSSAKFAVLNVNSGTPTASISGNFIAMPNNGVGGNIGIGTTNPTSPLTLSYNSSINGNVSIQSITNTGNLGTLSGNIARRVINQTSTFTPTVTLVAAGTIPQPQFYNTEQTTNLSNITIGDTSSSGQPDLIVVGNKVTVTGAPTINDTTQTGSETDLEITGSNVTVSPTFDLTNSHNVFAPIYAGYFSNSSSVTSNASSTIDAYGILAASSGNLTTTGTTTHYGIHTTASGTADNNYGLYISSVGSATNNYGLYINTVAAAATNYALYSNAAAQSYIKGNVGIGSTAPLANLDIEATGNGKGAQIINGDGNQTLFTASISGTPKFTIDKSGNVSNAGTLISTGLISANGGLTVANGQNTTLSSFTSNNNSVLYTDASGIINAATTTNSGSCLVSNGTNAAPTWSTCPGSGTVSYWNLANGALYPINSTLDLLIGSTASTSAKFAVLNVAGGTPTASVSATSTGTGLALGGDGTIQSLKRGNLILGGTTTGDIAFKPGNASTPTVTFLTGGNVGIGTTIAGKLVTIGSTGQFTVDSTGNLSTSGTITTTNATDASSTSTGSIIASGGVGIAKTLYVGTGIVLPSGSSSTYTQTYTGTSTAATITANSITTTNSVLSLSGTSLTTGKVLTLTGGSTMTTGNIENATATYTLGSSGTGSAYNIAVTNASSNDTTTLNGINLGLTMNTSSAAGADTINGVNVAPVFTQCSNSSAKNCNFNAFKLAFGTSQTQVGPVTGLSLDYNTNYTPIVASPGTISTTGIDVKSPAYSGTYSSTTNFYGFHLSTAGTIASTLGSGTVNWHGIKINMPDVTAQNPTVRTYGIYIAGTGTYTGQPATDYAIFTDGTAGKVGLGLLPGTNQQIRMGGTSPNSVSSGNGTVGGSIDLEGIQGGQSSAASATGGAGGAINLTGGSGGQATGTTVATGGAGGAITITSGTGAAASANNGTKTGGNGGNISIVGGAGGSASNTGTNNGGNGASIYIVPGAAGTGSSANGNAGNLFLGLNSGGTQIGNIGIGTTSTASFVNIGTTTPLTINSTGAITAATGITSSGTITFSGFTSNGGILYTNGSGVLAQATAGTSSQCLFGGTTPSFGSCSTGTNWWNVNSGALYPINQSLDLLVGGVATTSAKFALTGIAGTLTPVASISATPSSGTTNGLSLSGTGTIQSLNMNTLTLGGTTTGNILVNPLAGAAGGKLAPVNDNVTDLGATSSARFRNLFLGPGSLHVQCTTGDGCGQNLDYELGILSSGTGQNDFIIGANGTSGARNALLAISEGGNIGIGTTVPAAKLDVNGSGRITSGLTLPSGSSSTYSQTYTGSSVAFSLSGGSTGSNLMSLSGASLTTGKGINLSLGSSLTTGNGLNITGGTWNPGDGSRGGAAVFNVTNASTNSSGTSEVNGLRIVPASAVALGDPSASSETYAINIAAQTGVVVASGTINNYGIRIANQGLANAANTYGLYIDNQTNAGNNYGLYVAGTTNTNYFGGNVGIGSTSPTSLLTVSGIAAGNATAIFNTGNAVNDLFTASSSGTTKFTIANNGNIQFAGNTSFLTTLTSAASAARTITLPDATGTLCLTSTCATGSNWWTADTTNGVLYPVNNTLDLLVGGSATTSAKFAFTGVAGTSNPVASISATPSSGTTTGLALSGNGSIQALNRNNLTLGGSTTGAVVFSAGGAQRAVVTSSGNVGIGTALPASKLDVSGGILAAYNQLDTVRFGSATGTSDTLATFTGDNLSNYTNVLSLVQNSQDTETNSTLLLTSNTTITGGSFSGGGTQNTRNLALSMTPNFSISGGSTLNATGIDNAVSLSSLTLSGTGNATANVYGENNTLSGTPTFSGAVSGSETLNTYGSYNSLTLTPTLTSVRPSSQFNSYGGYFSNAAASAGNSNLTSTAYGIYGATSGNLTTTGTTTHYGGYFDVSGSADSNYGLYINSVAGATTNYGLYSASNAQNYFGGNVGIGTTAPTALLDVQGIAGGNAAARIVQNSFNNDADIFAASQSSTTRFKIANNGDITATSAATLTDAFSFAANTVTTGKAFNINANALTTGTGFNLSSTTTSTSAFKLASIDWSPGSSTIGTGDLLSLNMGANALGAYFLNLKDNGTSVFSVSQTQFTTSLPTAFTAPGDVANAYDLIFTNPTASYIKSSAPLTIQAGETFNSSDLTLQTFNMGNIVLNPGGSTWISAGQGSGNAALIVDQIGATNNDIFTASASGTTRVTIRNNGNVGIGTSLPAAKLDVTDSQTSTYSAFIRTTSTNSAARALAVQLGSTVPTSNQRWIDFLGGTGGISGKIIANGAGSPSLSSTAGDYAEYFHKNNANENMPVGTLVCLMPNGKVTACTNSSSNIIGVISDSYIVLGRANENPGQDEVIVGLLGQLPVFVSNENGDIQPGDFLTASSKPGVAMKATNSGFVIGKARESYTNSTPGKVDMVASPFYKTFDSTSMLSQLTVDPSGNIITPNQNDTFSITNNGNAVTTNITVNKLSSASVETGKLTARSFTILSPDGATKVNLGVQGNELVIKNAAGDTTISFDSETGNAYFSGEIVAKTIRAEKIAGLEVFTNKIADLSNQVASLSAQQASPSSSLAQTLLNNFLAQASDSSSLKLDTITVVNNLTSIGQTFLGNTNVAGRLTVGTITIDDFENSINSIYTLKIQNNSLAGAVDFFGGAIKLARNGDIITTGIVAAKEVKTKTLTISSDPVATNSAVLSTSAGKVTIAAGTTTKDVSTTALGTSSLIFATPIDAPVSVSAKKISSNTFRLTISSTQAQNIDINWWIVNTEVSP